MPAQIATVDDLVELRKSLLADIQALLAGATVTPAAEWYSTKEAAKLIGCNPRSLPIMARQGRIQTNERDGKLKRYRVTPDMIGVGPRGLK